MNSIVHNFFILMLKPLSFHIKSNGLLYINFFYTFPTIISYWFESHQNLTFETRKLIVRVRGQSPIVIKSKFFINE